MMKWIKKMYVKLIINWLDVDTHYFEQSIETLNTLLEKLRDGYIAICSISNIQHHNNYHDNRELKIFDIC